MNGVVILLIVCIVCIFLNKEENNDDKACERTCIHETIQLVLWYLGVEGIHHPRRVGNAVVVEHPRRRLGLLFASLFRLRPLLGHPATRGAAGAAR